MENNRKKTSPFDETKKCLYYSKEKGLYIDWFTEDDTVGELVCRPHNKENRQINYEKEIPEKNLKIRIISYFQIYKKAYLKAIIEYGDRKLLDFDKSKLYIRQQCSLSLFSVPVYEWEALFDKIISACNNLSTDKFMASAITYIEEINKMLNMEEFYIRDAFHWKCHKVYNREFGISSHIVIKLHDLIKELEIASCIDDIVINHTITLCCNFLETILKQGINMDKRGYMEKELTDTLHAIHSFMYKHHAGKEFLRLFLNNSSKKFT